MGGVPRTRTSGERGDLSVSAGALLGRVAVNLLHNLGQNAVVKELIEVQLPFGDPGHALTEETGMVRKEMSRDNLLLH